MQTYLPYPEFLRSAQCLDEVTLRCQIVQVRVILRELSGEGDWWRDHPAVTAWRGYERALANYGSVLVSEWMARGRNMKVQTFQPHPGAPLPRWIGDERVHASHRASLLGKLPEWYGRFNWKEIPSNQIFWPSRKMELR